TFQVFEGDADVDCENGASSDVDYCFTEVPGGNPQCDFGSLSPAYVVRPVTVQWYLGNNARQGTSLYRATITNRSGTANPDTLLSRDEIVEGVEAMRITYLVQGAVDYAAASGAIDWSQVIAVRIELDLEGTEGALSDREIEGTDGNAIGRTIAHVVNLRNREGTL